MENIVAIIPAYEPDRRLVGLVGKLKDVFRRVIIVDDGSRRAADVFAALGPADNVRILVHPANRGKGAALKTGFDEVLKRIPDATGVITADADGQHLAEDIVRVAEALCASPTRLALGVRTFGSDIPMRSRLGNLWTIAEFHLLTGHTVHDTQSGLRGIPLTWLPKLLSIPGERYDYEIGMLVAAVRELGGITEIPIATVYDRGNATSHYRPLADTFSTQRALFRAVRA